jgi:hypothetical protein
MKQEAYFYKDMCKEQTKAIEILTGQLQRK